MPKISGSMILALRVSRRARRNGDATGNLLLSSTVSGGVGVLDMLVHVSTCIIGLLSWRKLNNVVNAIVLFYFAQRQMPLKFLRKPSIH